MDTSPHSWLFTLILVIGSTARLTRLVTKDTITARARAWSMKVGGDVDHWLPTLLRCPWCMGVWVGFAVAAWAWYDHAHIYFILPAMALTAAQAAGHLGARE